MEKGSEVTIKLNDKLQIGQIKHLSFDFNKIVFID